jgi:hypothetical protein
MHKTIKVLYVTESSGQFNSNKPSPNPALYFPHILLAEALPVNAAGKTVKRHGPVLQVWHHEFAHHEVIIGHICLW